VYVFLFKAIGFWEYRYLEVERGLPGGQVMLTVGVFGILSAIGSLLAGFLGDFLFRKTPRGRMIVNIVGISMLVVFFTSALRVLMENFSLFFILQTIGSFFAGSVYPNATTTVQDIVEPEIRSTAHAVLGLADTGGSALAPLLLGVLAVGTSQQGVMLRITTFCWLDYCC
jgi:MFS family permease